MDERLGVVFVFVYGSLLSSRSLSVTLPSVDRDACLAAELHGHVRTFDVAFPNDGSQPDKAYIDEDGSHPDVVLFANVRSGSGIGAAPANGVLVPVGAGELDALRRRERRYDLVDVTPQVRTVAGTDPGGRVLAFVGRAQYTRPEQVRRGVVPRDYWATITAGAVEWEQRSPGFLSAFWASTQAPAPGRIVTLRRVDLPR